MYQVIARTWRPQKFSDVIGQEHVTGTIQNAIRLNRIGHGYIFSGQRGVGKTSIARLLAKALNCHRGPAIEPCGECDSCVEIASGRAVDVIEIDAASNRGIDAIRELRENARYVPARDRYKVFIIDEAHQITTEGFNALLKILEEPPAHVVFLLATTEVHQLPETIVSRCQHFSLHTLKFSEVIEHLRRICEAERIEADAEALSVLARSGEGSLRDALSRLEQAIAAFGNHLEGAAVERFLGLAPAALIEDVFRALKESRRDRILEIVEALVANGYQLSHFCGQIIHTVHNLMILRVAGPESRLVDLPPEELQRLNDIAVQFTEETLMRFMDVLLHLNQQLRFSLEPRFQIELGLLKLVDAERLVALEELLARMEGNAPAKIDAPRSEARQSSATTPIPASSLIPAVAPAAPKLTPWQLDQQRKSRMAPERAPTNPSQNSNDGEPPVPAPSNGPTPGELNAEPTSGATLANDATAAPRIQEQIEKQFPILGGLIANAVAWEFGPDQVVIRMTEAGGLKGITETDRERIAQVCSTLLQRKVKVNVTGEGAEQAAKARANISAAPSAMRAESRAANDDEVAEFEKVFGKRVKVTRNSKE